MQERDTAEGRRIAILIGQNRFPRAEHLTDLAFAEADMHAIAERLSARPGSAYDEILKIPTGPSYTALEQMEEVAAGLKHEDTLLIFYSGHGILDKSRRLNLAFENTVETRLTSTALKVGQLLDLFRSGRAKSRVLVLDCCYAGGVGAEFDRSSLPQQIETEVHGTGTVVLTSATKAQVARENPAYGHGIFTKHMLDGLAGAADLNGDGTITAQELYEYTHRMVTAESGQRPQRFNHELEGQIILYKTGLTPWKDKAYTIATKLKQLNSDHLLSDRLFLETFALAKKQPATMTLQERKRFDLLDQIDPADFRPGSFENAWNALTARSADPVETPREPAKPDEPEPPADPKAEDEVQTSKGSKDVLGLLQSGVNDALKPHLQQYWTKDAPGVGSGSPTPPAPSKSAPTSDLKATLILIGFVLFTLFLIGNAAALFNAPEDLGAAMIILAGAGLVYSFTRHVGTAKWRKITYWVFCGIVFLSGIGFLTNTGY